MLILHCLANQLVMQRTCLNVTIQFLYDRLFFGMQQFSLNPANLLNFQVN